MRFLSIIMILGVLMFSCEKGTENPDPEKLADTLMISMKANYSEDVFLRLSDGLATNSDRTAWDLGFSTNPMSSTVMINEGKGLVLYTLPGKTIADWGDPVSAVDFAYAKALYNSDTTWYFGAFDRNALGHPDYGWGVYNQATHDVLGDSIFVLKMPGDMYKKIMILDRKAATNTFNLKFADLDGSNEVSASVNCSPYLDKTFIYYSLSTGEVIDREPDKQDWDIVFSKYHDESIPYIVTGVLSNDGIEVAEVNNADVESDDYSSARFSKHISVIGSDWKKFDMGTFRYQIEPNRVYFIRDRSLQVFKLRFLSTDGSSGGNSEMVIKKILLQD